MATSIRIYRERYSVDGDPSGILYELRRRFQEVDYLIVSFPKNSFWKMKKTNISVRFILTPNI